MRRIRKLTLFLAAASLAAVCAAGLSGGGAAAPGPPPAAGPPKAAPSLTAALAAQERHTASLLALPGVVGTGVALVAGEPVIRVYTERAGVRGVPPALDGVAVSIAAIGPVVALTHTVSRHRPAPLGVSTGHPDVTAGTLGARVVEPAGTVYALSNNHVYANENLASLGDPVLQPGAYDGGAAPDDVLGTLADFEPIAFDGTANVVDAAIAAPLDPADLGNATLADGYGAPGTTVAAPFVGQKVQKYGRTTGLTRGTVAEVNVTVRVCYDVLGGVCLKSALFVDQVGIADGSFSDPGDSGSLIVTDDPIRNPVGLLFAGSSTRTFANPIAPVLDRFGVAIDGEATGPPNAPPSVEAGPDLEVSLPDSALLDGTVADDGRPVPPGAVTTAWTKRSGPGTVTFADPSAVDTTASFSEQGTYVLELTASDGSLAASDTVTVVVSSGSQQGAAVLYFALGSGATVGGVGVANEDVVAYDGASFSLLFDGSDVGVGGLALDAFAIVAPGEILMSFTGAGSVPGISGTVDDSDVVRFVATSLGASTSGAFSLHVDASDVGLTQSSEDVDAVELLPDGRLLLSTTGGFSVSGASGADEDLVAFTPTSLGPTTRGSFSLYFDGSDVGLSSSSEDVDGLAVDGTGAIHLSTTGSFAVPGASGADEDVFVFTPTSLGSSTAGAYSSTLFFDGSALGLGGNDLFAIDLP